MRVFKSSISLYVFILFAGISPVSLAQANQEENATAIDVASLLAETGYKYVEVEKGLWKIPDIPYEGKNLNNLIIFLQPNPNNKSLRISLRLGFLKESADTSGFKEKLKDLSKRFEPTQFVLSQPVLFVFTEPPADKLDNKRLEKAINELADVSDQAFSELTQFIESDLESSKAGYGAGAPGGPDALSPSILKTPDTLQGNIARDVDSKPVLLNHIQPSYTEEARNNNTQGVVTLRLLVDETGAVKSVRIIRGLPDGLNEKAVETAYRLKFKPAMKDGKAVAYWVAIQTTFNLR